jgi:mRNA interferase RelE/StbE
MNRRRYRIEYGSTALGDLDSLGEKVRTQVLRKIERLKSGLHGNIKHLRRADVAYRLRTGDYRILFDIEGDVIVIRRIGHRKNVYTKILEREIGRTVRQKRQQLSAIREEVENLLDYLAVLEARAKDAGKPRLSHGEVKKRYG